MATHHSTSRRTKSTNDKIVVPSWDSVWASFNAENQKTTIEDMNAEGWKTSQQVAESTGLSRSYINQLSNCGKFESAKRKVYVGGKTREIVFVRPKITTCQ